MKKTTIRFWVMLFVFLAAIFIRFYGVTWNAAIRYDLHPDEDQYIIGHALGGILASS